MRGSLFLLAIFAPIACAHEAITTNLTWANDIARLIETHCVSCHQPDGVAMSLLTYAEARPWAKAIRDQVLQRTMPPWDAVQGVGDFRDDQSLSEPEIELFVSWVEGGAPAGDSSTAIKPKSPLPGVRMKGPGMRVSQARTLSNPITLIGIRPDGPLEVVACLPDKSVQRLLWVRDFRPQWNRTYILRKPATFPRGTRILIYARSNASATLFTKPAQAQ